MFRDPLNSFWRDGYMSFLLKHNLREQMYFIIIIIQKG